MFMALVSLAPLDFLPVLNLVENDCLEARTKSYMTKTVIGHDKVWSRNGSLYNVLDSLVKHTKILIVQIFQLHFSYGAGFPFLFLSFYFLFKLTLFFFRPCFQLVNHKRTLSDSIPTKSILYQ